MKAGARVCGVAASDGDDRATLAAAVVRADRVVDGLALGDCTVGGTDATAAVLTLIDRLDRPDCNWILLSGVAPAGFNLLDCHAIHAAADRPVVSVSYAASEGLADDIRAAVDDPDDAAERVATYEAQPERHAVTIDGTERYLRCVGVSVDEATAMVRAVTPDGGRPEPVRVAREAARAGREYAGRV